MDLLIVGSGLFGLTVAERAAMSGLKVVIVEKRNHIGGNAFSYKDSNTNIDIHKYGSHIFHTSNQIVWDYVNRYTEFNNYVHKVYTRYNNEIYSMPINLGTINQFFKAALSPSEAKNLILGQKFSNNSSRSDSLEEKAISLIGEDLYLAFIKGYTKKQWQVDPSELPAEIITRLPIRYNYNNSYFDDIWQGIPKSGYTNWFERMVDHKNIEIHYNSDFFDPKSIYFKGSTVGQLPIVYTGPVDQYFNHSYGSLLWRTLDFEIETLMTNDFQGNSVINYANEEIPFTRIHEFKHLHPEQNELYELNSTVIMKEFSRMSSVQDEPFYPVNSEKDRKILNNYRQIQVNEKNVYFGGRLGTYKYLDMHMAIASALTLWKNQLSVKFGVLSLE